VIEILKATGIGALILVILFGSSIVIQLLIVEAPWVFGVGFFLFVCWFLGQSYLSF